VTRVFISYRHVAPDEDLARALANHLRSRGHDPFLDVGMHVGTRWVEEIESQIRSSQFFVVLLSKDSILSDMVRREVELAHKLARDKKLTILPVRITFEGELPYDLGAYLNPLQYAILRPGHGHDPVVNQIVAAIEHFTALPEMSLPGDEPCSPERIRTLSDVTEAIGAPLPAADPRLDTGAMKPGSPFYVRRTADAILERELQGDGATVVVKGPRQSGKSSLLARTCSIARDRQLPTCYFDFQLLDREQLIGLKPLLRCLARKIARHLKTAIAPEPWDDSLGDKEMLTVFVEEALLSKTAAPVLFVFDEVDRVFDFPYRDDFFALIRAWHNRRATQENWERLRIVLAHSTDPALWIQDVNQSPFNVGEHIQMEDFDADQVASLAGKHGLILRRDSDVAALMRLLGGQPYLVRQALFTLATRRWTVPQLEQAATEERGPFGDHLRQLGWRLQQDEGLYQAVRQILQQRACADERSFQRLKAAGLARGESRHSAGMRCELYVRYFGSQVERARQITA
jgi:hypothetical protein